MWKDGQIKLSGLFGVVIEPEKWCKFVHGGMVPAGGHFRQVELSLGGSFGDLPLHTV